MKSSKHISEINIYSVVGPSHNKVVVCYVSTWAVYRPDKGSFAIEHIDPNLCTHVVYAFAGLDHATDSIKSLGELFDAIPSF